MSFVQPLLFHSGEFFMNVPLGRTSPAAMIPVRIRRINILQIWQSEFHDDVLVAQR